MIETALVLERAYHLGATNIAAAIERILQVAELIVEDEREVFVAMVALRRQGAHSRFICRCADRRSRSASRLPPSIGRHCASQVSRCHSDYPLRQSEMAGEPDLRKSFNRVMALAA